MNPDVELPPLMVYLDDPRRPLPMLARVALLFFLSLSVSLARADLTPETVRKCKLATALVRVVDNAEGTAFHIGNGTFLTNQHVIEDAASGAKIEIVLNSGSKDRKVLKAQLARADEKLDLALLKVDEKDLPPALEIGETSGLVETMTVAIFGFPFGSDLAIGKNEFPNISVNVGRITALRQAEGKLEAIQVDATVSPGNSGGPLVSSDGHVIGVVQEHVPGAALTFAIPADRIRQFLFGTGMVLRVSPATFTPGAASNLSVELLTQKKAGAEPTVTITLSAFAQDQREYKATAAGMGTYTVSAPLIPAVAADDLNADIEDQGDNWSIRIKDHPVKIGIKTLQLSAIKEITQGSAPGVETTAGQRLAGPVTGLKSVACIRNGKPGVVDLSRSQTIRISKPTATSSKVVHYVVTVRIGSDPIATQKGTISAEGIRPDILHELPDEHQSIDSPGGASNLPPGIPTNRWAKNGHYYSAVHIGKNLSWEEANAVASRLMFKGKRGHLATITTPAENAFLIDTFPHPREIGFWLGGYQDPNAPDYKEPKGGWRWVTGEPWVYENWAPGQPDDGAGKPSFLHYFEDGSWDDAIFVSEIKFGFIVEFE
jgi:hypothetical protein